MKEHDQNTIERLRYLAQPEQQIIFQARSFMFQKTRKFLEEQNFLEVHLPSIAVCSTDPVEDPTKELFPVQWYDQEAYLIQSVQLHKQMLMAVGFPKIYSLAPFWRAQEVITPRHSGESWGLDLEISNISSEDDLMNILEKLITNIVNTTQQQFPDRVSSNLTINTPIPRLSYDEAISILHQDGTEIDWGEDPGYEREKRLGELMETRGIDIFFITRYPAKVKKFYTKLMDDPRYTATFDLIFRGWEVASGAQRETNLDILLQRIKEKNLNLKDYEDFLDIFRFGVPEHGGFCLGMDRVLAKTFGLYSVEDAFLFPRNKGKLRP